LPNSSAGGEAPAPSIDTTDTGRPRADSSTRTKRSCAAASSVRIRRGSVTSVNEVIQRSAGRLVDQRRDVDMGVDAPRRRRSERHLDAAAGPRREDHWRKRALVAAFSAGAPERKRRAAADQRLGGEAVIWASARLT